MLIIFQNLLTHFMPLVSFYAPGKYQKTSGFLMFSGGLEIPVARNGLIITEIENVQVEYLKINPFQYNTPFLPLKTSENFWFSDVFGECRNKAFAWNRINISEVDVQRWFYNYIIWGIRKNMLGAVHFEKGPHQTQFCRKFPKI